MKQISAARTSEYLYPGRDSYLNRILTQRFNPATLCGEGERPTRVVGEDKLDEVITHTARSFNSFGSAVSSQTKPGLPPRPCQ